MSEIKTAVQDILDIIQQAREGEIDNDLRSIRYRVEQLLKKEKQQILSAYDVGKEQPSNSQLSPIDYFNQTFK